MSATEAWTGEPEDSLRGAVLICVTATIAGAAIGLIGGVFRWFLEAGDRLRLDFVEWTQQLPGP